MTNNLNIHHQGNYEMNEQFSQRQITSALWKESKNLIWKTLSVNQLKYLHCAKWFPYQWEFGGLTTISNPVSPNPDSWSHPTELLFTRSFHTTAQTLFSLTFQYSIHHQVLTTLSPKHILKPFAFHLLHHPNPSYQNI